MREARTTALLRYRSLVRYNLFGRPCAARKRDVSTMWRPAGPVGRLRTRTSGSGLPPFAYSLCSFDRDLSRYARLASVATLRKVLTHSGWLRHPEVPRAARYPCTPVRAGCRSTLRDGTPSGRPPECWGINRREPPGRTRSGGVSTLRSVAKPPRPQGAPYSRGWS